MTEFQFMNSGVEIVLSLTLALETHSSTTFKGNESRKTEYEKLVTKEITNLLRYKTTRGSLVPKAIRVSRLANDLRETVVFHDALRLMPKMFRLVTQTQQNYIDMEPGHIEPMGEDI